MTFLERENKIQSRCLQMLRDLPYCDITRGVIWTAYEASMSRQCIAFPRCAKQAVEMQDSMSYDEWKKTTSIFQG